MSTAEIKPTTEILPQAEGQNSKEYGPNYLFTHVEIFARARELITAGPPVKTSGYSGKIGDPGVQIEGVTYYHRTVEAASVNGFELAKTEQLFPRQDDEVEGKNLATYRCALHGQRNGELVDVVVTTFVSGTNRVADPIPRFADLKYSYTFEINYGGAGVPELPHTSKNPFTTEAQIEIAEALGISVKS